VAELRGQSLPEQKEVRIDLAVKAFIPPGWLAQEALRLELYRRISLADDHEALRAIRAETVDRYGALPDQVETLFAIASLRVSAQRLGVEEIATYRDQVRLTPVAIGDALQLDLGERVPGATYHPAKGTLNLVPEREFGAELVRWVEEHLLASVGEGADIPV
jgi:transcription-repair coupling factor (superfamily II helicase)